MSAVSLSDCPLLEMLQKFEGITPSEKFSTYPFWKSESSENGIDFLLFATQQQTIIRMTSFCRLQCSQPVSLPSLRFANPTPD